MDNPYESGFSFTFSDLSYTYGMTATAYPSKDQELRREPMQ
jgi:hypothetical protein